MKKLLFILSLFVCLNSFGQGYFTYVLPASCNTSAGVYKSGVLVRTIWSVKPETAGTKTGWWDGNDDFGNAVSAGSDSIRILSSNVTYNWDGVIGNTSTTQTGIHTLAGSFGDGTTGHDAITVGSTEYWAGGYGEGISSRSRTTTANINYRVSLIGDVTNFTHEFVASDGTNVYWAFYDGFNLWNSGVYATTVSSDANVNFSSGTTYHSESCLDFATSASSNNQITGLAVQQTHSFIITTRAGLNQIVVSNKTTGATAQTITTVTSPGRCAIDNSDNVWIADASSIKQYSINSGTGALTATGNAIALTNVGGLAVSPNGTKIAACDMTNEQVKQYNFSGSLLNTLGTGVSYQTSPAVANNKFYWSDSSAAVYYTFVSYMADSSILVGDRQNNRVQHFASNFSTFIESQAYSSRLYTTAVDNNNSQRAFGKFCEYTIDYTKSIGSCWTLANNWGGRYASNFDNQEDLNHPVTISGHTFTMLRGPSFVFYCVELVAGYGIRYTGITKGFANGYAIDPGSGALIAIIQSGGGVGSTFKYENYAFSGLDGSNNPIWSGTHTDVTFPASTATTAFQTNYNSNILKTSLGNYIIYGNNKADTTNGVGEGYHLASASAGTTTPPWKWQALPSTSERTYTGPFPGEGQSPTNGAFFDNGNGVNGAGSAYAIYLSNIFVGYNGEFWKNGETNYYFHYDDSTGLLIGEFGRSGFDYPYKLGDPSTANFAVAQEAGNALNASAVLGTDGKLYMYTSEETSHEGIHRWSITGLSSVSHQTAVYTPGGSAPVNPGTDLLSGFTRGVTNFSSGTGGWTRTRADYTTGGCCEFLVSKTGSKSYDITKSVDLSVKQQTDTAGMNIGFTKPLISAGQRFNNWQLTFDALWDANIPNGHSAPPYTGGSYIEVLDSTAKIIAENHMAAAGVLEYIVSNGIDVLTDTANQSVYRIYQRFTPDTLSYAAGSLTINYGGHPTVVTVPFQSGADMTQPYTLKLHFFENSSGGGSAVGKSIAIQNAFFSTTIPVSPPSILVHRKGGHLNFR